MFVALVAGDFETSTSPRAIANLDTFCQIHQTHDIAGVHRLSTSVGHPHLKAVDGDTAGDVRQGRARSVVSVVEIVGEEEVAVLVVVVCLNLIRVRLATSSAANGG